MGERGGWRGYWYGPACLVVGWLGQVGPQELHITGPALHLQVPRWSARKPIVYAGWETGSELTRTRAPTQNWPISAQFCLLELTFWGPGPPARV